MNKRKQPIKRPFLCAEWRCGAFTTSWRMEVNKDERINKGSIEKFSMVREFVWVQTKSVLSVKSFIFCRVNRDSSQLQSKSQWLQCHVSECWELVWGSFTGRPKIICLSLVSNLDTYYTFSLPDTDLKTQMRWIIAFEMWNILMLVVVSCSLRAYKVILWTVFVLYVSRAPAKRQISIMCCINGQ